MGEQLDCEMCKECLYGRKYIQVDDVPHCVSCYDRLYANTCQGCKELIGHNSRELYYDDRHYHEECFHCSRCDRSLAEEPFACQEEALLCNDCYCSEFSSKCVACNKNVMPGTCSVPAPSAGSADPPSKAAAGHSSEGQKLRSASPPQPEALPPAPERSP